MPQSDTCEIYAIVAPGLESLAAKEIQQIAGVTPSMEHGGLTFHAGLHILAPLHHQSRIASRFLVRIASFKCRHLSELHRHALRIPWLQLLPVQTPIGIKAACHRSRIYHTGAVVERIADAIEQQGLAVAKSQSADPDQSVFVRFDRDHCTISLDASGELLYRRHYKTDVGPAPFRETHAAAALMFSGWTPAEALVDPMCGSGTFLLEAAQIASGVPPARGFAHEKWPRWDRDWSIGISASSQEPKPLPTLVGNDIDSTVMASAEANAKRARVAHRIQWRTGPASQCPCPAPTGLLICNPPWGDRLGSPQEALSALREIADLMAGRFLGWRLCLVTPNSALLNQLPLSFSEKSDPIHLGNKRPRFHLTHRP